MEERELYDWCFSVSKFGYECGTTKVMYSIRYLAYASRCQDTAYRIVPRCIIYTAPNFTQELVC